MHRGFVGQSTSLNLVSRHRFIAGDRLVRFVRTLWASPRTLRLTNSGSAHSGQVASRRLCRLRPRTRRAEPPFSAATPSASRAPFAGPLRSVRPAKGARLCRTNRNNLRRQPETNRSRRASASSNRSPSASATAADSHMHSSSARVVVIGSASPAVMDEGKPVCA